MVKILHISDTHLGFRLRRDYRRDWYKFGEIRWYENDFYLRWEEFIDYCIKKKDNIDFIIHSGDLFNFPFEGSNYPSPEPARERVVTDLKRFFQETENQIPFILIDGNHGIYQSYRYSLMDSITPLFTNLFYFSIWDLKKAIDDNEPLICEFPSKNTRFYLFPYFKYEQTDEIKIAYDNWIENQRPREDMIEIAVVHGSDLDQTLHSKLKMFNYDYVALGHEHNQRTVTKRMFFSGSFVPLNFNEVEFKHGFLEVELNKKIEPIVIDHRFDNQRIFEIIFIELNPSSTSQSVMHSLSEALEPYRRESWDGKTSARLKIQFAGNIALKSFWGLNDELNDFKSKILNSKDYNILQLSFSWNFLSKETGDDFKPEIIKEYILNNPKEEFMEYLKGKIKPSDGFDMDLLAEIAIEIIEKSLIKNKRGN